MKFISQSLHLQLTIEKIEIEANASLLISLARNIFRISGYKVLIAKQVLAVFFRLAKLQKIFLFFIFLIPCSLFSSTNEQEVEVRVKWLKDTVLIGEPAFLNVIIKRPEFLSVSIKEEDAFFKPFLPRRNLYYKASTFINENYVQDSILYALVPFELDSIQSISIIYEYSWKGKLVREQTSPNFLYVQSILGPDYANEELKKDLTLISLPLEQSSNFKKWLGLFLLALLSIPLGIFLFKYFYKQLKILRIKKEFKKHISYLLANSTNAENAENYLTPELIFEVNRIWQKWLKFMFADRNPASMTSKELETYCKILATYQPKSKVLYELRLLEEEVFYAQKQIAKEQFFNKIPILIQILEVGLNNEINAIRKSR